MTYKDFAVWKKAMQLAEEVYLLTSSFPREEQYGLVSQMRRAAVSIPSNIAEGQGRGSDKEFSRFLGIAHGSLAELETQLFLSERLGFVSENKTMSVSKQTDEIGKMLRALIRKLKKDNTVDSKLQASSSQLQAPN